MKGIAFEHRRSAVTEDSGQDAWDDLLDVAGVHGAYRAVGSYPDSRPHRDCHRGRAGGRR